MRLARSRWWGVRTRSAAAAVAVGAVAALVAGAALLLLLRSSLQSSADATAAARCAEIAVQLQTDPPAELDRALLTSSVGASVIQVLDPAGAVVAASPGSPVTALTAPRAPSDTAVFVEVTDVAQEGSQDGDHRVTAQGVQAPTGRYTVVVAASEEPITETLTAVGALLLAGAPVLVLLLGAATYLVVGRSLRPVERMRATVEGITSADLTDRLTVPLARDEISRLATTLNAMLGRLETGQEAQRRFVADASHELRSPLSTVTAALELAVQRPQILDAAMVGDTLLPEAQRMQHLVEDLLLLAKADERGLPMRVVDVDVDDILDTEAIRLRTRPGLTVHTTISPTRVRGDAGQLARVVRNLADNAARHARGAVTLSCRLEGGSAEIAVTDDGAGIPSAERTRVLERFVRLDDDRARGSGGSGLGLAIVAEIVAAHDGAVTITAGSAGGARVVVTVPIGGPVQARAVTKR